MSSRVKFVDAISMRGLHLCAQEPDFQEDEEMYEHLELIDEDPLAYQDDFDFMDSTHLTVSAILITPRTR
jgi:hypothetical protein